MIQPILNQITKLHIQSVINNPPQALIIFGQPGSGLTTVAKYITNQLEAKPLLFLPEKDNKIDQINGIIGVDIIRQLYQTTASRTKGKRMIIIEKADTMTSQAQNAFLKLLEEPKSNNYFILLANNLGTFLPTILSRASRLEIKPITDKQSIQLLDSIELKDTIKRHQIIFMANHRPAELYKLATNEDYFNTQLQLMLDSKSLLTSDLYHKLLIINKYKDSRPDTLKILQYCLLILKQTIIKQDDSQKTINYIDDMLDTHQQVSSNGNIRLWLTKMALQSVIIK